MTITEAATWAGQPLRLEYHDADAFDHLPTDRCRQVYGVCFAGGQLVVGFGGHKRDWGLIGGTIEPGESFRQTLDREIQEEANMRVLAARPIGYQIVTPLDAGDSDQTAGAPFYQLRYWARVEPIGPFVADPAGGVTKIKLIDPRDSPQYFDWGRIGARLIERGLELEAASAST